MRRPPRRLFWAVRLLSCEGPESETCPYVFEGAGSVKEDLTDRPSGAVDVTVTGPAVRGEVRNHADFIWSVADLLHGDYKRSEYGKVILPLTVLRRLDGVLEPTKERVLERQRSLPKRLDPILNRITRE